MGALLGRGRGGGKEHACSCTGKPSNPGGCRMQVPQQGLMSEDGNPHPTLGQRRHPAVFTVLYCIGHHLVPFRTNSGLLPAEAILPTSDPWNGTDWLSSLTQWSLCMCC